MPDPRSTVELALACRDAEWIPPHIQWDRVSKGPGYCEPQIERIVWAAAVHLLENEWEVECTRLGLMWSGPYGKYREDDRVRVADENPLRATLLAAIAAEEQS